MIKNSHVKGMVTEILITFKCRLVSLLNTTDGLKNEHLASQMSHSAIQVEPKNNNQICECQAKQILDLEIIGLLSKRQPMYT